MKVIVGITGGIASGKSAISSYVIKKGYNLIDSDLISKDIMNPGKKGYEAVYYEFGPEYFTNGKYDRDKMGKLIFNDESQRARLNKVLHPAIRTEIRNRIQQINDDIIFVDIPLLFEASFTNLVDYIITVYVPFEVQKERLIARDNITEEYAISKINSQMSLEKKKELSDFYIDNSKDINSSYEQFDKILKEIQNGKNFRN